MGPPMSRPSSDDTCPCNTHTASRSIELDGNVQIDVELCDVWGISLSITFEDGDGSTLNGLSVTEARSVAAALANAADLAVTR
jgi:hypothetical protein